MNALAKAISGLPVYGAASAGSSSKAPGQKAAAVVSVDKLRRAACKYDCVLCGKDKRHTVAAHCDDVRAKGIGKKTPGYMLAYVCGDPGGCHDLIDGRAGGFTKARKRLMWLEAHWLTVWIWFRDGLVRVV